MTAKQVAEEWLGAFLCAASGGDSEAAHMYYIAHMIITGREDAGQAEKMMTYVQRITDCQQ